MVGRKKLAEQTRGRCYSTLRDDLSLTSDKLSFRLPPTLIRLSIPYDTYTEFKKLPDEPEKFSAIKTLLKAYQTEIDHLTRRSKMSESSFLSLYKALADAPDPYPLLDAAVDQTVKVAEARMLESELGRLREENVELKKRVGELGGVEEKRKKADGRAEQLEERVSVRNIPRADGGRWMSSYRSE
jgi:homeobox protein cut-like